MGSFPSCQFKFGISPSMSSESELCKTDMIAGCDPVCLCNICHLHQDWTQAMHIINRLILLAGEETAAKELCLKDIWELSIDLNNSPPRSSVMCKHCGSLRAHREWQSSLHNGLSLRTSRCIPAPKSSGIRPLAKESQVELGQKGQPSKGDSCGWLVWVSVCRA